MTKNEKQDLEALKIGFEMTEWEDFLLVLNEIRDRDKEIISMYRHKVFRMTNAFNNTMKHLEFPASPGIAVMELKKALTDERFICVQTGGDCGFPCYDGCPIHKTV